MRLSAPPSKVVSSYSKLWAYAAHYRCATSDPSSHATYNCEVSLLESEVVDGSIDIRFLDAVYMVSFGSLNVVVMKVAWLKDVDQGQHCIKKDSYGFWTTLHHVHEDPHRRNQFLLPRNASQVFFDDDEEEAGRKVVILHEPSSRRVVGFVDTGFLGVGGTELALETPLDFSKGQPGTMRGAVEVVPNEQVSKIEAHMGLAADEDIFDDTQFVEEVDLGLDPT